MFLTAFRHSTESNHGDLLIPEFISRRSHTLNIQIFWGWLLKLWKNQGPKSSSFGRPVNLSSDFVFKHPNYIYSLARSCLHHSRSPWTDGHFEASMSFGSSSEWRRRGAQATMRGANSRCEENGWTSWLDSSPKSINSNGVRRQPKGKRANQAIGTESNGCIEQGYLKFRFIRT